MPPRLALGGGSTTAAEAVAAREELNGYLRQHFSEPDPQALEIAHCVYVSHTYLAQDPVWLFIIGPPGTGKTGIVIRSLSFLPDTHIIGDMTPSTFLSGFGKSGDKCSLLNRIGNGVLLFKDFTTMLVKKQDQQAAIISQLREVHDGRFTRPVGSRGKTLDWAGKITVVAACTPALERAWSVTRELGDRFLAVRWSRGRGEAMAALAARQIGGEKKISEGLKERTLRLLDPTGLKPASLPDPLILPPFCALVEFAAVLRTTVIRGHGGEIVAINEPEGTSRLMKGLVQLAQARATLMRRGMVLVEDLVRVQRAVLDSIPQIRLRVIEAIPDGADASWGEIMQISGLNGGPLQRPLEELQELGVLRIEEGRAEKLYRLDPEFAALKARAFPLLGNSSTGVDGEKGTTPNTEDSNK